MNLLNIFRNTEEVKATDGRLGEEYLKEYLAKTRGPFKKFLRDKTAEAKSIGKLPGELMEAFSEIATKGKRIRGALVVLGYEAAGGRNKDAILDASSFIELIHSGLLVHDDIQDNDDIRRGVPTIHKRYSGLSKSYGVAMGLNAGISAYYLGMEKLAYADFPEKNIVRAMRITSEYITRVTHGQALDVSNVFIENANKIELLNILKYKSAEYTGVLPLLAGATLAGKTDTKYLSSLVEYGLSLGWAFQIQDDILGAFGETQKLGKPVGSDFKEGKVTLLMLHLARHGTKEHVKLQKRLLGKKNISQYEVRQMQDALRESGAYDQVIKMGWDYVKKAEGEIENITSDRELQNIFQSLLYFMMERVR